PRLSILLRRRTFLRNSATATAFACALTAEGDQFGGLLIAGPGRRLSFTDGSPKLKLNVCTFTLVSCRSFFIPFFSTRIWRGLPCPSTAFSATEAMLGVRGN